MRAIRMRNQRAPLFRRVVAALQVAVLCVSLSPAASSQVLSTVPSRLVAIGDVHGDYDALVTMLQNAELLDAKLRWSGGDAVFVQVGDFLDRGPDDRKVMDLLMRLEKEAPRKGGRVIVLLGNHEAMNLIGDLRYVSEAAYASYSDKGSQKRREKAYRRYVEYLREFARSRELPAPVPDAAIKAEWMKAHPLGYIEHRQALEPQSKYGAWLRSRPAMARVGNILFVHGGVSPALATSNVEAVNKRVEDELRAFDIYRQYLLEKHLILPFFDMAEMMQAAQTDLKKTEAEVARKETEAAAQGRRFRLDPATLRHIRYLSDFLRMPTWYIVAPEGPLWFRGFAEWPEEEGAKQVAEILASYGAERVVVGHTTQKGEIRSRFGGKIFLIDTGMLTSYYSGGRPSALEIRAGEFTAIYPNERVALPVESSVRPAGTSYDESEIDREELPGGPLRPQERQDLKPAARRHVWLDADGKPLPFQTDEEIMEFLRTAKVMKMKTTSRGITRPSKVLLEKDGIRMNAAFRTVSEQRDLAKLSGGRVEMFFRDDYIFECAAYVLARLLGLDNVPPVVVRRIFGQRGSLQIWVEQAMTETDRLKKKIPPKDAVRWNRQVQIMRIFDHLVFNTDRNQGNILIDQNWKLWMIDHTRAFRRYEDLEGPQNILQCERKLFERLQALDPADVRRQLDPYLYGVEINALLKRRDKIVEIVRQRIAEKGEERALFDLD